MCLGFLDFSKMVGSFEIKPVSQLRKTGSQIEKSGHSEKNPLVICILPEVLSELISWSQIENSGHSEKGSVTI